MSAEFARYHTRGMDEAARSPDRANKQKEKSLLDRISKTCFPTVFAGLFLALTALAMPENAKTAEAKESSRHKGRVRNPPDVEVIPAGLLTVDEEVNLYAGAGISNTTVDYGLPYGWNIGVSFLNAQFYAAGPTSLSFQPDVLFNLEKYFRVGRTGVIVVGAQTGAGILPQGAVLMNYSYLDYQWHWLRGDVDMDVGVYYGNAALAGKDSIGWHVNVEVPIVDDVLRLNGDYLSGKNGLSGAVVKLLYTLAPSWQVSFGVQIPAPRTGNDYSGLLGLYWH